MPRDEFSDDESWGFTTPPPPDDRLWRHPSELRGATASRTDAPAPSTRPPRQLWVVGLLSGLVGAVGAVGVVGAFGGFDRTVVQRVTARPESAWSAVDVPVGGQARIDVPDVARKIAPVMALVETDAAAGRVTGSALALRSEGYLVTSAELIPEQADVFVVLADGGRRKARVIGSDPYTNVAVLALPGESLRVPTLGSGSGIVLGADAVVVTAAPDARSPAVSSGVISALDQQTTSALGVELQGLIRTDASVAPNVRGGALVDRSGLVVGLITTVTNPADTDGGGSLAAPIGAAREVAASFITYGYPSNVWLGIYGMNAGGGATGAAGGALVTDVRANSPAAAAGLAASDVIVGVDDVPVDSMATLVRLLRARRAGQLLRIELTRGGQPQATIAYLGAPPSDARSLPQPAPS
ncbi:MAG: S1C family serine protease [Acidimicrobiales bacterium]